MLSRMSICLSFTGLSELPQGSGLRHTSFIVYIDGLDASFTSYVLSDVKGSMVLHPAHPHMNKKHTSRHAMLNKLPEVWLMA